MWLRVNQQQNNTKTYRTLLEKQEIAAFECDNPHALRLAQPLSVSKLPNFEQGAVTVQDLNAQWSALLLEPQYDELIFRCLRGARWENYAYFRNGATSESDCA